MTRHVRKNGFVLLMTLGLIGLAAIALAGFARHSLELAVAAQDAQEQAQRRWGEVSCRRMLLDRAEDIFQAQTPVGGPPPAYQPVRPRLAATFALGSQQFEVALADENAKVNINTLVRERPERVQALVHQLMGEDSAGALQVRIRTQTSNNVPENHLESWGQVFDLANLQTVTSAPDTLAAATSELTCWGDGRLNALRASDTSLRTIGGLAISGKELGELLRARHDWPDASLDDLLRQLNLRADKLAELHRLLSDQSDCHSLWVHVQTRQRRQSTLLVAGGGSGATVRSSTW